MGTKAPIFVFQASVKDQNELFQRHWYPPLLIRTQRSYITDVQYQPSGSFPGKSRTQGKYLLGKYH